jgi:hypothetical protein
LPYPIRKIIFTYAAIYDPEHIINLVRFCSITVYNFHNQPIFYIQQLEAVASPSGWNSVHGRGPGPHTIVGSFIPASVHPPPPYVTSAAADPNAMAGRGYNTFHGFDIGPPPPGFPPGQPTGMPFSAFFPPQASFALPQPTFAQPMPAALFPQGWGGLPNPATAPLRNGGFPGIHLRNHTGGVGLPPGYDYAFPREHTKIHVFKTGPTPPWQQTLWSWDGTNHVKLLVPCTTTVKELMQNLGCTNSDANKNKLHEIQEAGNGRWVKGITISGSDKDRVKKQIAEFGWDKSRTGAPGERPVVWLWCTKD